MGIEIDDIVCFIKIKDSENVGNPKKDMVCSQIIDSIIDIDKNLKIGDFKTAYSTNPKDDYVKIFIESPGFIRREYVNSGNE